MTTNKFLFIFLGMLATVHIQVVQAAEYNQQKPPTNMTIEEVLQMQKQSRKQVQKLREKVYTAAKKKQSLGDITPPPSSHLAEVEQFKKMKQENLKWQQKRQHEETKLRGEYRERQKREQQDAFNKQMREQRGLIEAQQQSERSRLHGF